MNLNGTVAMAGGTTSLGWIGCEVLQSCAAIHAFINIQRDASGEKELSKRRPTISVIGLTQTDLTAEM